VRPREDTYGISPTSHKRDPSLLDHSISFPGPPGDLVIDLEPLLSSSSFRQTAADALYFASLSGANGIASFDHRDGVADLPENPSNVRSDGDGCGVGAVSCPR